MEKITIAQVGLGDIGRECVRLLLRKPWARVVAGVETDPAGNAPSLGAYLDQPALKAAPLQGSAEALLAEEKPQAVILATVSTAEEALHQIRPYAEAGLAVVASAEELVYPYYRAPDAARALDALCRESGARVLATGVNPGFVMDLLPICLTSLAGDVERIQVERVVDASRRRPKLQQKIGASLTEEAFVERVQSGVVGHKGLQESLCLLAYSLGWKMDEIAEECEPIVALRDIRSRHFGVPAGHVRGLRQVATGKLDGKVRIQLALTMALGEDNPHDRVVIRGTPPLEYTAEGGIEGDAATVASLVNALPRLLKAPPGLHLPTDLAVPAFA